MSDRSDEVTKRREAGSTDELLEETERLLAGESVREESTRDADADRGDEVARTEPTSSRSSRSTGRSAADYFSPKAFLAFVLVFGSGLFAGGAVIPWIGAEVGIALVAFLAGVATTKRRYLELSTASAAVGAVSAVVADTLLATTLVDAVPHGIGSLEATLVGGAGVALLVCLLGYYFGRDLRDGLSRDV